MCEEQFAEIGFQFPQLPRQKKIHTDNKGIKVVKDLCVNFVILRPGKCGGIVLMTKQN